MIASASSRSRAECARARARAGGRTRAAGSPRPSSRSPRTGRAPRSRCARRGTRAASSDRLRCRSVAANRGTRGEPAPLRARSRARRSRSAGPARRRPCPARGTRAPCRRSIEPSSHGCGASAGQPATVTTSPVAPHESRRQSPAARAMRRAVVRARSMRSPRRSPRAQVAAATLTVRQTVSAGAPVAGSTMWCTARAAARPGTHAWCSRLRGRREWIATVGPPASTGCRGHR